MSSVNRLESHFRDFNINGIDIELDRLPTVSKKTQQVMESYGFNGPQLKESGLKNYMRRVEIFEDFQKNRDTYERWADCCSALSGSAAFMGLGLALLVLAVGDSFTLCVLSSALVGTGASLCLGRIGWELEKWDEEETLRRLKPEAKRYIENFVRYYQTHGPELRSILERALHGKEERFALQRWFSEREQLSIEDLSDALEEINEAVSQPLGEKNGIDMTVFSPHQTLIYA